jgi:hypothetical protein
MMSKDILIALITLAGGVLSALISALVSIATSKEVKGCRSTALTVAIFGCIGLVGTGLIAALVINSAADVDSPTPAAISTPKPIDQSESMVPSTHALPSMPIVPADTPVPQRPGPRPSGQFSIRPFVTSQDDHILPLSTESAFSNVPRHNVYQVHPSSTGPFMINQGWCAKDFSTLYANLSHITIVLLVNDTPISTERLSNIDFTHPVSGFSCSGWAGIISFMQEQEYSVTWLTRIDEGLNDGAYEYPPGNYVEEYTVIFD